MHGRAAAGNPAHLAERLHHVGRQVGASAGLGRDGERGRAEELQPTAVAVPLVHGGVVSLHVVATLVDGGEQQRPQHQQRGARRAQQHAADAEQPVHRDLGATLRVGGDRGEEHAGCRG